MIHILGFSFFFLFIFFSRDRTSYMHINLKLSPPFSVDTKLDTFLSKSNDGTKYSHVFVTS